MIITIVDKINTSGNTVIVKERYWKRITSFSDEFSRLPVQEAAGIAVYLNVYFFLSRESGVNMSCFYNGNKSGFAKLTVTVSSRNTMC